MDINVAGVKVLLLAWLAAGWVLLSFNPGYGQPSVEAEQYDLNFSKGLLKFRTHQYEEAASFFTRAMLAKPADAEAAYYLGQTLIRLNRLAEAESVFKKMRQEHPESGRAFLGLGMAQFYQEQYSSALDNLISAQARNPKDPLIHYYEGLTYAKLGTYDQALEAFSLAMAIDPGLASESHHQRGIIYAQMGLLEQAKVEFEAVLSIAPGSELAQSAETNLQLLAAAHPQQPRPWDLMLSISPQYDSNVVLLPLGVQPPGGPSGISRKDDTRIVLTLRTEYRPIQRDRWIAGVSYNVYQSFHRVLNGFDVQNHTPSVFVQHQGGKIQARVQYNFDYVDVGRSPFLLAHSILPTLTVLEGSSLFTQFEFRYQDKEFRDDRFQFNSTRNGKNWLGGVTQYVMFAGSGGYFRAGYVYDTDRTGGGMPSIATPGIPSNADWAYQGHRILGGVGLPRTLSIKLNVDFDYYLQLYDNPNSFSPTGTVRRRDDIYRFIGTMSREITPSVSVAFQYAYTRNQSNVSVFDYARSVYSLILSGRF